MSKAKTNVNVENPMNKQDEVLLNKVKNLYRDLDKTYRMLEGYGELIQAGYIFFEEQSEKLRNLENKYSTRPSRIYCHELLTDIRREYGEVINSIEMPLVDKNIKCCRNFCEEIYSDIYDRLKIKQVNGNEVDAYVKFGL